MPWQGEKSQVITMIDWDAEARRAVGHVESELSEAHRGAFCWHEPSGVVLIFDNRLYKAPVPEKQLAFVKEAVQSKGGYVHAIAHSEDGGIWTMLVTGVEPGWAFDCVWAGWHSACSQGDPGQFEPLSVKAFMERGDLPLEAVGKYQYGLAQKTIQAHFSDPRRWKNCRPDGWTFRESVEEDEPE